MRNLLLGLAVLPLLACTPAGDKADTGEAIAEGAGVGDGPTGRVGRPVAKGAEQGPIPHNINEGIEEIRPQQQATSGPKLPQPPRLGTERPTLIPGQFQGRWGLNANDCKGGAAAKGLLTIDDSRLIFYESRGVLDRIDAWTPANRFTANYGFSGEGQEWERLVTLERTGNKLRRTEKGGDEGPVDLTYTACPPR
jgi:hypothetical protein